MNPSLNEFRLSIDSLLAIPTAENYRPLSWPPKKNWPVVIDAKGVIVSRYGDSIWRLEPWTKGRWCLNFGDGPKMFSEPIDQENADLLRQITAWWLWGPRAVRQASTLTTNFARLRPLFVIISKSQILASSLSKFPAVIAQMAKAISSSNASNVLTLLHDLYAGRNSLGFTFLDQEGLILLASLLPHHETQQTPYIPPRIWTYQVTRLRQCLDEFAAHREQVELCYKFCLEAYAHNYGTLRAALVGPQDGNRSPFSKPSDYRTLQGLQFHGAFELTAARYGVDKLLLEWVGRPDGRFAPLDVASLGRYLNLVSRAGLAYILNFSLMRVSEGLELRADCLHVEHDPKFGDIHVLRGETTKTLKDSDARWPTSPSVKVAVEAMTQVAQLKLICAKVHPLINLSEADVVNPLLTQRCVEPWVKSPKDGLNHPLRRQSYATELTDRFPRLFRTEEIVITENDLQVARLVNPSLDEQKYKVGATWSFAYHQLRRTGSVNMQASGLISDASLQYLLKHATRAMSLYYGQGFSKLRLNNESSAMYVRTMYEVLGKEFAKLLSDRFISPHGEKRKTEVVRLITPKDAKKLEALASSGEISCRQIIFGYCMNKDPCPFGGIDSVAHCGGADSGLACPDVLYDRAAIKKVETLSQIIDERLSEAPARSPLYSSLLAQKSSVANYLNAITSK